MTPEETVADLKKRMYTAAVGNQAQDLVAFLRLACDHIDNGHAFVLAMAIAIGAECATNESIPESDRDKQVENMIAMVRLAYDRALALRAEGC